MHQDPATYLLTAATIGILAKVPGSWEGSSVFVPGLQFRMFRLDLRALHWSLESSSGFNATSRGCNSQERIGLNSSPLNYLKVPAKTTYLQPHNLAQAPR